ncbi:MAG: hypothetical protein H0U85_06720, partial [Gemmatimonadales bacterium]|nr:hypothetical protein [Gemmatimonadales bacterium]
MRSINGRAVNRVLHVEDHRLMTSAPDPAELNDLRARLARLAVLDDAALAAEKIAVLGRKGGALTQ